jgi:hypothetical protein
MSRCEVLRIFNAGHSTIRPPNGLSEVESAPPFLRDVRKIFDSSMRSWLPSGQMRLAKNSRSGLRAREDTTSLHREDVARTSKTAKVACRDVFLDTKDHGGSVQPIRH